MKMGALQAPIRLLTNPRFFGGFVFLIGNSGDFRIQAETRRILQFLL